MASSFRRKQKGPGQSRPASRNNSAGQIRIVAGRWRGRKLAVPDVEGLRPTGDRVRETLFNWIQDSVAGAHCLDLFAGSGALGFEALSRYAKSATFVEPDGIACRNLRQSCELLEVPVAGAKAVACATKDDVSPIAYVQTGTAQEAIQRWVSLVEAPGFNLVFIDPPFQMACQWTILEDLAPVALADGALIYIESPTAQLPPERLPQGCQLLREKRFGDVVARLLRYSPT